ncbi:MAG: 1-acyl-sn-glycerol-3-phosphate acyltransferase [Bacteroidota bacterium]
MTRLLMPLYARSIRINKIDRLQWKGPLLLASNHPNSFLDSVILDTLFEKPIWSLARGDAFGNKWVGRILHSLRILPVYRTSEGPENLHINYRTFESCIGLFKRDGIVTIYSEAKCVNEWRLRPLRKGTARLAMQAWSAGIPLRVLPVSINYSSFHRYGKNLVIEFGEVIESADVPWSASEGKRHQWFNEQLERSLRAGVIELNRNDSEGRKKTFHVPVPRHVRAWTLLPALLGWILHAPLYSPIRLFVTLTTHYNDHYDSIMAGLLFLLAPIYWAALLCIGFGFFGIAGLVIGLLAPFTVRALLYWLPQTD